jgi:hypothetical protein
MFQEIAQWIKKESDIFVEEMVVTATVIKNAERPIYSRQPEGVA